MSATLDDGTVTAAGTHRHVRVAIVGSGFSGLAMAIGLRRSGVEDFLVFERADEVGGTWRDNTYPGAACDVMAHLYSFSFARNPNWRSTFGSQSELLAYLKACAERFGVLPHVRFGHEMRRARWDDGAQHWEIETSAGTYTAQVLVSATGYLSEPAIPAIAGLDRFEGTTFHSARWDHDHDLTGRRVAVIGTGASAIQFVPKIQPVVGQLDVYQRTPPWVGPKNNKPNKGLNGWMLRKLAPYQRFRRGFNKWGREGLAFAMARPRVMGKLQKELAEKHLRKSVADPEMRARLTPDYVMGCKRILFSDAWYPALQEPNVDVVTDGIAEVRAGSVVTTDGRERPVDTIVLGTGFATTDRPVAYRIEGRDGRSLRDAWQDGMTAYLGTTVAGFPNMFMLLGPNTTSAHTSMTVMIEAQVAYVTDALRKMDRRNLATVEVTPAAQAGFAEEMSARLDGTVWTMANCASWYRDENGRATTLWPTYAWRFRRRTRRFDLGAYEVTADDAITRRGDVVQPA